MKYALIKTCFLFLVLVNMLALPSVYADLQGKWVISVPQNDVVSYPFKLNEGEEFIGDLVSISSSVYKSVTIGVDDPNGNTLARYPLTSSVQISVNAIKTGDYTIVIWNNDPPYSSSAKWVTIDWVIKTSSSGNTLEFPSELIFIGLVLIFFISVVIRVRANR